MRNILIVIALSALFSSCNQSLITPNESSFESGILIKINGSGNKGISVSQWDVTSLDINIVGTVNKSATWTSGSSSSISIQLPEGHYSISIVHHGVYQGTAVSATESATFSIEPMKITIITITPGDVGTVTVGTGSTTSTPGYILPQIAIPAEASSQVNEIKKAMIGTWVGTMTCPWISGPTPVTFTFRNDDTYSANTFSESVPALYYGTDTDSPDKQFQVYGFTATGSGIAQLVVYFGDSGTVVVETINDIVATPTSLDFNFKHFGTYGPIYYSLTKQ